MLQKLDLDEIAKVNPTLDLEQLAEWRRFRESLPASGQRRKPLRSAPPFQGRRARIVDDAESDPRLVRLQR